MKKLRALRAALACVLAVPLLTGCATLADRTRGNRPDPMSTAAHPLERLLTDPLFASLPPGAVRMGEVREQPHNEPVIFGSGGTFGGAYIIDFSTSASLDSVRAYYAQRAAADGWTPVERSTAWRKVYPDGVTSTYDVSCWSPEKSPPPYTYTLIGSI